MKIKFYYLSILLALFLLVEIPAKLMGCALPTFTAPTSNTTISRVVITKPYSKFSPMVLDRKSGREGNTAVNSGIIFSQYQPYYIEVTVQSPTTVGLFIDVDQDGLYEGAKDYFLQLTYKIGSGGNGTIPIPRIYYGYVNLPDTTKLGTMAILTSDKSTMTKTSFCNASIVDGDAEYYTIGINACSKPPVNLSAGIDDTICTNANALLMGAFPSIRGSKAYWKSTVPIVDSTNMNQRSIALNSSTEFFLHYYDPNTQCEYSDTKWAYVNIRPRQINLTASTTSFCEGTTVPLELSFAPGKDRTARLGSFTKYDIEWWKVGNSSATQISSNDIYNAAVDGSYYATVGYYRLRNCAGSKTTSNTIAISYLPKPKVTVSSIGSCTNKAIITATGVNPLSTFSWKLIVNNTTSNAPSDSGKFSYYPTIPGNYFVEVLERGFQCKGVSSSIAINQTPQIPVINNVGKPLCTGQSDTLKISSTRDLISYYEWYSEPSKQKLAIGRQYVTSTSGNFSSKAFGVNGCISDFSKPVIVTIDKSVKPKLSYQGNQVSGGITLCTPTAIDLAVRQDSINTAATQWYVNNIIKPSSTGPLYKTGTTFTGKIYVKTTTLISLCTSLDSVSINIVDQKPATITATGDLCIGQKVTLSSIIDNGTKYIWKKDGIVITSAISKNLEVISDGNYNLDIEIENNLCRKSALYIAKFNSVPNKPTITGRNELISGDNIILTANTDLPQAKYQWYRGGFVTDKTPTLTVIDSGKYQVKVTSIYNCNSLLSNVFEVFKLNIDTTKAAIKATADISGGGILGSNILITVNPNDSRPPWSVIVEITYDSAGTSRKLDERYVFNTTTYSFYSKRAGTYRIKSINLNTEGNGVAFVYITDRDSSEVFVWNAISPNGDGKNDLFEIEIPKRLANKNAQIVIFDREGTRLADDIILIGNNLPLNAAQDMYIYQWNCKNPAGELLNPGSYFFSFKVTDFENDKRASKSGFLEVRR